MRLPITPSEIAPRIADFVLSNEGTRAVPKESRIKAVV